MTIDHHHMHIKSKQIYKIKLIKINKTGQSAQLEHSRARKGLTITQLSPYDHPNHPIITQWQPNDQWSPNDHPITMITQLQWSPNENSLKLKTGLMSGRGLRCAGLLPSLELECHRSVTQSPLSSSSKSSPSMWWFWPSIIVTIIIHALLLQCTSKKMFDHLVILLILTIITILILIIVTILFNESCSTSSFSGCRISAYVGCQANIIKSSIVIKSTQI